MHTLAWNHSFCVLVQDMFDMHCLYYKPDEALITTDPNLTSLFRKLETVIAPSDQDVLIEGETGTGKEGVARAFQFHSRRRKNPFVAVNCAVIPEYLAESEFFGHVQGSFTGAHRDKIGLFEQADGGILFLDEISSLLANNQARLLRVLQEQEFVKLGSSKSIKVNVRVVTACGCDLWEMVKKGEFRKDLYFRLVAVKLRLPPLRERRGDIPCLAEYFLNRFRRELNLNVRTIDRAAMRLMVNHCWPGNVRELINTVHTASIEAHVQGKGKIIQSHLPEDITAHQSSPTGGRCFVGGRKRDATRQAIIRHLSQCSPSTIRDLADRIGRDRSVVYRQIIRMERDGLLSIDRRRGNPGSQIYLN